MTLGIIGLGRMGMNIARRLLRHGHRVVAYNRTSQKTEQLQQQEGAIAVYTLEDLIQALPHPRVVWLMLPAGDVTEAYVQQLSTLLQQGDILIDGANSHYKDSINRARILKDRGVTFLDIGVSGGVWGLTEGFCLMIGGEYEAYERLIPVFESLSVKGGFMYCGPSGAGHYIKMVHNAIEYALMEAYAEGFQMIQESPYRQYLNTADVAALWLKGSVIRSWLLELVEKALREDPELKTIKGYVEDSGEGRWAVAEAMHLEVPLDTIALSLFKRFRSRQQDPFSDRLLAALRAQFGGHRVIKNNNA